VDGAAVEAGILRQALTAQGLSPSDVDVVLARLTPTERTELAQRVTELGVGGDPALLLIVGIVLLVAILLYLPMAGRMQGWW
jgi:ABC-type nitrate/sulfonate/bicarbonate transport system substrate-binding protein